MSNALTMHDAAVVARHLFGGLSTEQWPKLLKLLADVEDDDGTACGNIAEFMFRWAEEDDHPNGVCAELWVRFHNALDEVRGKAK